MCGCVGFDKCPSHGGLAPWERELLGGAHPVGVGDIKVTVSGGKVLEFADVMVDSVSPSATAPGVVAMEFYDSERVVHIPFVEFWEFSYRY